MRQYQAGMQALYYLVVFWQVHKLNKYASAHSVTKPVTVTGLGALVRGCVHFASTIAGYTAYRMTTSCRFKCVPQNLGSLSIHLFKLLFFLITYS